MNINSYFFTVIIFQILVACGSKPELATPIKIGDLERTRVIEKEEAVKAIDQLHGLTVAADNNVIAEYGASDPKDLLYISQYKDPAVARQSFDRMMKKIADAKDGPFFHLMPLRPFQDNLYFTMGMGAAHYVYISGRYILWYQTYQSVGMELPPEITDLYVVDVTTTSNMN
jgi:hypothetical protein